MGNIIGKRLAGALMLAAGLLAAPTAGQAQDKPQGLPVEAVPVRVQPMTDELLVVGSLLANESTVIRPEIAGRVEEISFDEGGRAEKGQLLVKLDDDSRAAELKRAEANLSLSQRNFNRAEELYRRQNLPVSSRDEALAKLRADEAALELARVNMEKTELRAPFSGLLGLRQVSVGDYVRAGDAIVNLEDVDPIKVDFRVPEVFAHRLETGQSIRMRVDAVPGETFEGTVYAIDPQVDVQGRSVLLRARVPNMDGPLRPGMFARVTLVLDERPNALVVPEEALIPQGTSQMVYKVVDGMVEAQPVTIGQRRKGIVEVTGGLSEGDTVITAGQIKVRPGQPVTVMPAGGPGAEGKAGGDPQAASAAGAEG
ncbi:putative Co/Zn/Cd efflux system membrane fusion protein [Caenispirillum salinarum AK4]|uniref:Putative Co/Zn/Cd efflux system membrane fusion protein n=1 Tax=Caenispirillum salinarum AK4 TaxID=1238182 RepID=K9HHB3_9PROT|nr:efflux RND transporter periplasmic adaptor subunit [Caenispirillum salinarum]EKV29828.1 putative Co/Zn/Cd efflux system membrane fusion protein [Caenispirillum salinarum AK4]